MLIKRTLTIYQMRFVIRSAELAQLWRKWIILICQMNMSNSLKFD
ncbi:putative transposase domain protein [Escherichia coli 2-316-03_S1_C2]|nr:putative transposase domain protein [Escherichia coli 2-005-03_S3_C2]KDY08606.1 putative transposase domain protein [Escherichia coli 2-316-03_S4_C1]KEJ34540.1 putative transposase domain protein [Escherichia coli 2-316-03_S1_C2]